MKLSVVERVNVRSLSDELLDKLHRNDVDLVAQLLQDPAMQRRNRFALDWGGTWRLDTDGSDHLDCDVVDVNVRFATRIPLRPVGLIADGFGISRAKVKKLIVARKIVSAQRLSDRLCSDFTFTFKR